MDKDKKRNPYARAAGSKPATVNGNYIEKPGLYDFLIEKLEMREEGFKGNSFIANLRIESSRKTTDDDIHNPGESKAYVKNLKSDFMYELMMAFMYTVGQATGDDLSDMDEEQIEEFLRYATSKDQPCRGVRVRGDAFWTTTQKGEKIIAVNWTTEKQSDEEIASQRKTLR